MKKLKAFFRFILFLIVFIISISLIFDGIWYLGSLILPWFLDLSKFWKFIVVFFGLGILWQLSTFIISVIMSAIVRIPVNKQFAYYVIFGLTALNAILQIYNSWTLTEAYSLTEKIFTVLFNVFILIISFSIIGSSSDAIDEDLNQY